MLAGPAAHLGQVLDDELAGAGPSGPVHGCCEQVASWSGRSGVDSVVQVRAVAGAGAACRPASRSGSSATDSSGRCAVAASR